MESWLAVLLRELHLDSGSLTGWPYLLPFVIVSLVLFGLRARSTQGPRSSWWEYLLPRRVIAHPSSRLDFETLALNALVGTGSAALGLGAAFQFTQVLGSIHHFSRTLTVGLFTHVLHVHTLFTFRGLVANAVFTLAFAAAYDAGRVASHYAMHKVPWLWEIHKVHHSAEVLTPFTAYRLHPIEFGLRSLCTGVCVGLCSCLFLVITGRDVDLITLFGVSVVTIWTQVLGIFEHGNKWLNLGRLGYLFANPANHLIHHSSDPRHRDKNFANYFGIFDLLLGTLYIPKREEHFPIGVSEEPGHPSSPPRTLAQFYLRPIADAVKTMVGRSPALSGAGAQEPATASATRTQHCWCGPSCEVLASQKGLAPERMDAWTSLADLRTPRPVLEPAPLPAAGALSTDREVG